MSCKSVLKKLVFVILFFSFVCVFDVQAADDDGKEPYFCVICNGDENTYLMEKQFIRRIQIIKDILGDSVDEVALAATVLHKESAMEAIKTRYEENWDDEYEEAYKNTMLAVFKEESQGTQETQQLGTGAGITTEKIDLLIAAAIVMANSSGWTGKYNEIRYQEALAGEGLITGDGLGDKIANKLVCNVGVVFDAAFTLNNISFQFMTGQDVLAEIDRTATRWTNMKNICNNGYIGGVYDINEQTQPDEEYRNAQKEAIADEIMDLIHYYKILLDKKDKDDGEYCSEYGGSTQAKDLEGKSLEERINIIGPVAQRVYAATGVWASVTIAQAIGESHIGMAYEGSGFLTSNNVFGVTCGRPGKSCLNGYTVFDSLEESLADRKDMFDGYSGYGNWRSAKTANAFIEMIGESYCPCSAGCGVCATYGSYANYIKRIMDENNLRKWDNLSVDLCPTDYGYNGVVTSLMRKVVEEAKRRSGGRYDGLCEAWVERVWSAATGIAANAKDSAYAAWKAFGVSTSKNDIPPGAMVYASGWPYYGDGTNPYGHVGVYVGNGKVADQQGVQDLETWVSQQQAPCNGHYGWFGWGWMNGIDLTKK